MNKLNEFIVGKANTIRWLLKAVRLRDVPWLVLGFVAMILISPEEEGPKPTESKGLARRRNASPKKP